MVTLAAEIVTGIDAEPLFCGLLESTTEAFTVKLPETVGVPLIIPALFPVSPVGNPVIVQL